LLPFLPLNDDKNGFDDRENEKSVAFDQSNVTPAQKDDHLFAQVLHLYELVQHLRR